MPTLKRGIGSTKTPDNFLKIRRVVKVEHKTKYNNRYIQFNRNVVNRYFGDKDEYRIAMSFEKDRLIMVFNPPQGVPFYKLSIAGSGKNKSKALVNSAVVDKIYEFFNLDKKNMAYYLKIFYFAEINNMELMVLTPQSYDTMQPVFEDELNGENAFHIRNGQPVESE